MKKTKEIEDKIDELRTQVIATAQMTLDLARTNFEHDKAKEQGIKLKESWNEFLNEWQELQKELQVEAVARDAAESTEEKTEFARLTGLVKKAF